MSDRITVTRHPDGVSLTPGAGHYEALLRDVFDLLAQKPLLRDDLLDLIDGPAVTNDPHLPDVPSRDDDLAARIVAGLAPQSLAVRLQHAAAVRLRDNLAIAPVPTQREAGAA